MAMWNPWRGCRRCSEGCLHCYIHKGDAKRNVDTGMIVQTKDFMKPVERLKNGSYKMKAGMVYTCFQSDFLLEEADKWRAKCWRMIKERQDCTFLFLTKRIERFMDCIPDDWNDGYENVIICCTVENRKNADYRLGIFKELPIRHKCITAQPLLEGLDIEPYLDGIELVVAGGESDYNARVLDYSWVLDIREQCIRKNVSFEFRQCGTHFIKDGKLYKIPTRDLCKQAKKAGIDFKAASDELVAQSVYPNCRVIDIYGNNYSEATRRTREASRAIIVKDGSILLSHEKNIGQWMTPGGGCEADETPEACCIRETAEETGLVVTPENCFLVINEYYEDVKYVSYYFECSVRGEAERKPTAREIEVGAEPEWVAFDLAMDIFSHHRDFAESNEERRGIYLKEYTALTEFAK